MKYHFVVLVKPQLHLNIAGLHLVFQAEKRSVYHQLLHVRQHLTRFQVVNAQHSVSEGDSVRGAVAILGIVEHLLALHLIADGVVHKHVQRLLTFGQFLPKGDTAAGEFMQFGSLQGRHKILVAVSQLIGIIIDPMILASAQERMASLKV